MFEVVILSLEGSCLEGSPSINRATERSFCLIILRLVTVASRLAKIFNEPVTIFHERPGTKFSSPPLQYLEPENRSNVVLY